jgi:hypothetical protein
MTHWHGNPDEWWGADYWWAQDWRGVAPSSWAAGGGAYTSPAEAAWWQSPWGDSSWPAAPEWLGQPSTAADPPLGGGARGGKAGRRGRGGGKGGGRAGEALPPADRPTEPRCKGGVVPGRWEQGHWRPWFGEGEVLKALWPGSVKQTFGAPGTEHSWAALQALADVSNWSITLRSRERGSRRLGTFRMVHVLIIVAPVREARQVYGLCIQWSRKSEAAARGTKYPRAHNTFIHRIRGMKMDFEPQEHSDDESDVDATMSPEDQRQSRVLSVDDQMQVATSGPVLRGGGREAESVGEEFPPTGADDDDARSSSSVASSEQQPESDEDMAAPAPPSAAAASTDVTGSATAGPGPPQPPASEQPAAQQASQATSRPRAPAHAASSAEASGSADPPAAAPGPPRPAGSVWDPAPSMPASAHWTPGVAQMFFAAKERLKAPETHILTAMHPHCCQ